MPLLLITLTVMALLWLNIDSQKDIRPWPFESHTETTFSHVTASGQEMGWPQRFKDQKTIFNNVWNGPMTPAMAAQLNNQSPLIRFEPIALAIDIVFGLALLFGVHFTFRNLPNARLTFDLKMMFATTTAVALFIVNPTWRNTSITILQFFALGYITIMVIAAVGYFCSTLIRYGLRMLRRDSADANHLTLVAENST